MKAARNDYYKWSDYNKELIKRLFTNESLAQEYEGIFIGFGGTPTLAQEIKELRGDIESKIHRLESIRERLEIIPVAKNVISVGTSTHTTQTPGKKAFIVHGHDEGARESVARFIEKLSITPIILHEQASGGRTIIEKLERNSDVDFAVVLLTPDDVGAKATATDALQARARQNVVLELGYFVGRLDRSRVCALYKGEIELPSELLGVVYIPLDEGGAWRVLLAKELREAGFNVDLNAAL
jgi:predicted nucleotide-binding protein